MLGVEPMKVDDVDGRKPTIDGRGQKKKPPKKKILEPCLYSSSPEEKRERIIEFRNEINNLLKYCKELILEKRGSLLENVVKGGNSSLNGVIACSMEESDLPLSKLVNDIFEKVKNRTGNGDRISKDSIRNTVLKIGQRLCYGVTNADADVLEDEAMCARWCWETRDLKLMPKPERISLKDRRTCRRKIGERITAVSTMINALEMSEDDSNSQQELMKASEKLGNVLNEADIRVLMENMSKKSGTEMDEKEAKREEKLLIKQMEKMKKEMEKKRKKMDWELQREKLQSEKELKRLHDEAEKEERRREKEENDIQKQLKRQHEEAQKDQRRKDKEEAELRRRLAIQKQASLMERFLKRSKVTSSLQNESYANKAATSGPSFSMLARNPESVTLAMDSVLAQNDEIVLEDMWKSHLNAWHSSRCLTHSNRERRWGIRQKPKTELYKELKLTTTKEQSDEDLNIDRIMIGWEDSNDDKRLSQKNTGCGKKRIPAKLLQFDKSFRPAFYGVWPRKSQVVGARSPFVKDSDIDYDVDSDEEWAEDEPGESLSDCDKDDEDEKMEGLPMDDEEDESEDGFFVPDGYLSENEGVVADGIEDHVMEEVRDVPTSEQSEEFCALLHQQKYLYNLTEHALKKNQPLIILNLMHEKTTPSSAEELTGTMKLESVALQALSLRPLPGFSDIEISVPNDLVDEDQEVSSNKLNSTPLATLAAILDSDLPQIISIIQSSPQSIRKIEKLLHDKFPAVPKSQLRKKVREISEFSDNRWRVKKEIISKYGLSISPEKCSLKMKSIAAFLKKKDATLQLRKVRTKDSSGTAPQPSEKCAATNEPQVDC